MDVSETRTGFSKNRDEVGIRCQKLFQDFLEKFIEDGEVKYLGPCRELEKMERNCLEVSFDNVEEYNQELSTVIVEEYYRVYPYLCQALANVVKDYTESDGKKEFFVSFIDVPTREKLRELRSTKVGTLIRIRAQVIRTHPVHPELISGTFTCLDCNTLIRHVEQQFKFTQPTICRNPVCNNRRRFRLETDKSIFIDFQKIKVQEVQSEQLPGSIPRSYDVILRAENVETVQSGSQYDFTGTLISVPDIGVLSYPGAKAEMKARSKGGAGENVTEGVRGLKALGVRHLNYRLAFLACSAVPANLQFYSGDFRGEHLSIEDIRKNMTDAEWNKVYDMSKDKKIYENLIGSLFPDIYGSEQVKKGVLLMLFGGVTKKTMEGTALRGDINCCIVGDPSTAKSLLLSQIAEFWPRCIYTSGKASSAAGLTAAVVKDDESSDFVIEPGAVLLADNGVCCIDEFDKMDLRDQVAIHEAMEQQTISIAKAGVRATLNARTSILAAANPVGGRYDRTKSLQQNVSLTAPIMSRFDLFFVMIDECNEVVDYAIAEKILAVHMKKTESTNLTYTKDEALRYITFAKQFKPLLTKEAKELLVNYYIQLRERDSQISNKYASRVTVRQLESMIRLSEAMAKMECSDEVLIRHVSEAYNLLNKSIIRVEQPDIVLDDDTDEPATINREPALQGGDGDGGGGGGGGGGGDSVETERAEPTPQELPKKKLTLSYDQYVNLTNALVVFIIQEEERRMAEDERRHAEGGEKGTFEGIRKSDVVNNYLECIGEELESEEELLEKKGLIEKVMDRLLYQDQVLIPITPSSQASGGDDAAQEEDDDPLVMVHPNYVL